MEGLTSRACRDGVVLRRPPVLSAKGPAPYAWRWQQGLRRGAMPSVEAKGVAGLTRANRALIEVRCDVRVIRTLSLRRGDTS